MGSLTALVMETNFIQVMEVSVDNDSLSKLNSDLIYQASNIIHITILR
jgi:hypothetical protein